MEAFAVPNIEATTIARLLVDEILGRHRAPRRLLSDRGANFLSSLVREVCFLMNTHKVFTTSYHPQCDGLVERFNGTMAQCISHYVDSKQKNWDMYQRNPFCLPYQSKRNNRRIPLLYVIRTGTNLPAGLFTITSKRDVRLSGRTPSPGSRTYRDCPAYFCPKHPESSTTNERPP